MGRAVAADVMTRAGQTISLKVERLVTPIDVIARSASGWRETGEPLTQAGHPSEERFRFLISEFPQISSMYFGYENGEFFQVFGFGALDPALRSSLNAPGEARFATRYVLRPDDAPAHQLWRYLDTDGKEISRRDEPNPKLDPRDRPWYQNTIGKDSPLRTDVYSFESTGKPGFTIAVPISNHNGTVLGIDVSLSALSNFLANEPLASDGLIAILEKNGEVIARSDSDMETTTSIGDPVKRDVLDDLIDVYLLDKSSTRETVIEYTGIRYLIETMMVPLGTGREFVVAIAVPENRFTGHVTERFNRNLIISLIVILLFIPPIWILSRTISKPLNQIAEKADNIRRFNFESTEQIKSRIREINKLSTTVDRMQSALSTFQIYVPKTLVRQMIRRNESPVLGGHRCEISVMFSDIAGFTDFSENIEPEALMLKLSGYFEELTTQLMNNGATVDKYIGDSIMALWNAPSRIDGHAAAACRAILACVAANKRLNAAWQAKGEDILTTYFGLNSGQAVVGNVGSTDRMNYTAIGATVNLAARLEGLNRYYGTQILVSDAVRQAVGPEFLFRVVDMVSPKGFEHPVLIHELVGEISISQNALTTQEDLDADIEKCRHWERIHQSYLDRQWNEAMKALDAFLERYPHDPVALIYKKRVTEHQKNPPPTDWTGVTLMTRK